MRWLSLVALVILSTEVQASEQAIWDVYPKLVCQYVDTTRCSTNLSDCSPIANNGIQVFNFLKNEMHTVGIVTPLKINGRYHLDFHGAGPDYNVLMVGGSLWTFLKIIKPELEPETDKIEGISQSAGEYWVFTSHVTCHPD